MATFLGVRPIELRISDLYEGGGGGAGEGVDADMVEFDTLVDVGVMVVLPEDVLGDLASDGGSNGGSKMVCSPTFDELARLYHPDGLGQAVKLARPIKMKEDGETADASTYGHALDCFNAARLWCKTLRGSEASRGLKARYVLTYSVPLQCVYVATLQMSVYLSGEETRVLVLVLALVLISKVCIHHTQLDNRHSQVRGEDPSLKSGAECRVRAFLRGSPPIH